MVTLYNIKKNSFKEGKPYLLVELRGLSTDTKPKTINNSIIENGSVFVEIDTQDIYFYDLSSEEWLNPNVDDTEENEVQEQVGE